MNEYDGPQYTKVRNDFMMRSDLSAVEKLILIYLHSRFRLDGEPWDVNADEIRIELHLGYDSTDKALSKLKAKAWLTDNRTFRDADGHRVKSTVIQSRRGEVIAPDMDVESLVGKARLGTLIGESRSGYPDRESPTVIKDCPMKDSPNSNAHKTKPEWSATNEVRATCSCGWVSPTWHWGDQGPTDAKADAQRHEEKSLTIAA